MKQAFHFTSSTLRDGRPIPAIGEWLEHDGPLVICESGLHASERVLDALQYAPGLVLHSVTVDGDTIAQTDKVCSRRRRIDSTVVVPVAAIARLALECACFAAWCAGLYLPELLAALEAADREDWYAASYAARDASGAASYTAASYAASYASYAASYAASGAARDASYAARDASYAARDASYAARDALETRARELFGVT